MTIQEIARAYHGGRLGLVQVEDLEGLRGELSGVNEPFVLFLAMDARGIDDGVLGSLALSADDAGLTYVCAWGPDCERVHDRFDAAIVGRRLAEGSERLVMTTWHAKDELEQAVDFFVTAARPAEPEESNLWLAVSVANNEWTGRIARQLRTYGHRAST